MITNQEYLETVKSMRKRTTRLEREGDYWTQEEREKLTRLFDSGAVLTDIAIQLQRTEPAVYQQAEKLDLYQRKEKPARHRNDFPLLLAYVTAAGLTKPAAPVVWIV